MNTESNQIEYKASLTENFEREVVAFLNYHEGGEIWIGIDDNGDVFGVEDSDSIQLKIVDRIKNNILPATMGLFDVIVKTMQDKQVINIIISSGLEKPYYLRSHGMSPKGCFLRVGSSAQPMTTAIIDDYYSKRVQVTLSNMPSPRSNLTFEQLKIYYEENNLQLNDQFKENLDLLTKSGQYNYAAYMLADNNGVSIKVAKYAGTDKIDLIENEEYGYCSIIKATNRVLDKLNVENRTFAKITYSTRLEKSMVDKTALREAVINAIVHNDYSREVPPVFEIYSDRLTVTSYGGLVSGLSQSDFFKCRSMPRNRELMRIFKDIGLVEQLGSGMSRILNAYDKSIFEFTPHFLVITFPYEDGFTVPSGNGGNGGNGGNSGNSGNSGNGGNGGNGGDNDDTYFERIIEVIAINPSIKLDNLCAQTGIAKRTLSRELKKMQENGVVRRVGTNRTGYWEIIQ